MRYLFAALAFLAAAHPCVHAQSSSDEQSIRDIIASADSGRQRLPFATDAVLWSGADKKPWIQGRTQPEEVPGDNQVSNRVPGSGRTKTTVERIEVATSGDLAYEFSNGELSFQVRRDNRTITLTTSALRVWRKEGGQWKVAAQFVRPHYGQPDAAATR